MLFLDVTRPDGGGVDVPLLAVLAFFFVPMLLATLVRFMPRKGT